MGGELKGDTEQVVVFIDGQNLFHLAKEAWGSGYHWPKYDPVKLARELTILEPDRSLKQVRFYSGVPTQQQHAHWHRFWTRKMRAMQSQGVVVFKGRIMNQQEKGVDVRLALDLVRAAREKLFDTAIVVSQDSDLNEALKEVVAIATAQRRRITLESASPFEQGQGMSRRGLTPSRWRRIDRGMYDRCVDPTAYTSIEELESAPTIEDLKRKFRGK